MQILMSSTFILISSMSIILRYCDTLAAPRAWHSREPVPPAEASHASPSMSQASCRCYTSNRRLYFAISKARWNRLSCGKKSFEPSLAFKNNARTRLYDQREYVTRQHEAKSRQQNLSIGCSTQFSFANLIAISLRNLRCFHTLLWTHWRGALTMRGGDNTPSECTGLPHPTTRHGRVDSLSGLYFEPQVKSYCQFHSINGLMGKPLVDGAEFVTTMSAVLDADKAAVRPLLDKDVSWKLNGSCSDIALNHYLHQVLQTQDGAAVTLYTIPQRI